MEKTPLTAMGAKELEHIQNYKRHISQYIKSAYKTVKNKTWEGPFLIFAHLCQTDRWFCKTSFPEKAKNIFGHNEIKLQP